MARTTHLKSLQALDMALRTGSLKEAGERLGITAAAVGQRIRSLETFLGTDLLVRGRSGLYPTPDLQRAQDDLAAAFAALERVSESLEFQRLSELHIVADPDWAELWLAPRLPRFREIMPSLKFCINGAGDVPMRLGNPDIRVSIGADSRGEVLFTDRYVPVSSVENAARLGDWDKEMEMEGLPLLHTRPQREDADVPGWEDWFARFGLRRKGIDRGIRYRHMRQALQAVRESVAYGFAGLALAQQDLAEGTVVLLYPASRCVPAPHPYRIEVRDAVRQRPQAQRFLDWLEAEAAETRAWLARQTGA